MGLSQLELARASRSEPLDQPGVNQKPVEAPRLRALVAAVEHALAAEHDAFLLGKGRVERYAGGVLDRDRKIGSVQSLQRRRHVLWTKVDAVDRVVGREVARVRRQHPLRQCRAVDAGLEQLLRNG